MTNATTTKISSSNEGYIQVPLELISDNRINLFEKFLLSFIANLSREEGYCYASNEWLAEKLNSTSGYVKNCIINLKKFGFIEVSSFNKSTGTNRKIQVKSTNKCFSKAQINANENTKSTNMCQPKAQICANVIKDEKKSIKRKAIEREGEIHTHPETNISIPEKLQKEDLHNSNSTLITKNKNSNLDGGAAQKIKPRTVEELQELLIPHLDTYGKGMIREFYEYWTERSAKGLCRFQKEEFFDVKRRLSTWSRLDKSRFDKSTTTAAPVYTKPQTLKPL